MANNPRPIQVFTDPHPQFGPEWSLFFDEIVPAYVKKHYSPHEKWKEKPFSDQDCRFFARGVYELSERFTEDRGLLSDRHGHGSYLEHPKFRSSYLLYFYSLQAAKFFSVFQKHASFFSTLIKEATARPIRVLDLGAGPGTASVALLMAVCRLALEVIPQIELHWVDVQREILRDGKVLLEEFISTHPKLRGKIKIHFNVMGAGRLDPSLLDLNSDLILVGHLLNEQTEHGFHKEWLRQAEQLFAKNPRGGILTIEPAAKSTSQRLSFFRNWAVEQMGASILGPCPHLGHCPLSGGRDWCHFSVPVHVPGEWFKKFSQALGSERGWLKFSYVWLLPAALKTSVEKSVGKSVEHSVEHLVVSDPIQDSGRKVVFLCQPDRVRRFTIGPKVKIKRGDRIVGPLS